MTRVSANFMANKAGGLGGAIYNESGTRALNLIADDYGDILFVGNTDSTGYNDIYNKGIINLNAEKNVSNTHSITFTGTITGSGGKIYINPDSGPQDGNYIFHNTISGNTLFLRNGAKIWLGGYNHETNKEFGEEHYTVSATSGMQTYGSLDLDALTNYANGGEINSQNGHIEANSLKKVTLGSNINLKIDADLSVANEDERADNYSATEINANKFIVDSIVVNKDSQTIYTRAKAANDTLKSHYDLSSAILTATSGTGVTNTYKAKYDGTTGYLLFANMTSNLVDQTRNEYGFYEDTRTYNMNANEDIATDITNYGPSASTITSLGELQGTQLTINGNGKSVSGSNNGGISVGSGQTLTMNNIASVSGFVTDGTNNGGFLTNAGTVNINAGNNNVAFSSNKVNSVYNDVYNIGTINLNAAAEKNITFDGAVTGTGTLVLNNDSTVKDGEYHFNSELGGELEMHNGAIIKLGSKEQADSSTTYGTLNLTSLTNDANGGLIDSINNNFDEHNFRNTTLLSDLNFKLDMNIDDLANPKTDKISATYSSGSGEIVLSEINLLGSKSWDDFGQSDAGKKIKILTSDSNSLQLGLSDDLAAIFENSKIEFSSEEKSRTPAVIQAETDWVNDYYKYTIVDEKTYGKWGLAKTSTDNDSLGFIQEIRDVTRYESMGDALALVNQSEINRSFKTDDATKTYELGSELGPTASGNFTIQGAKSGSNISTVNLNNKSGFALTNATNLTLTDVKLTGASGDAVTLNNSDAQLNVSTNSIVDGNVTNTQGTVDNNGTITGDVTNSGTFTNDGSIGGDVDNTSTFTNNSTITGDVANSGAFTNDGTIGGNVTNSGTLTSSVNNLQGTIENTGTFNATGELAKAISGNGTTKVNSTLTLNSGASVEGTLNMNGGTVTVSTNDTTSHNIGTLAGNGNLALDINSGTGAIDNFVLSNASSGTLTITSLNDIGTKPTEEGTYNYTVLTGSGVTLDLANSIKTSTDWYQAESTSHGPHTKDSIDVTTDWDKKYYDRWTDTTTGKSIDVSGNKLVYNVINHQSEQKSQLGDTLALVNQANIGARNFTTDDATKTYTLTDDLGETKAGDITIQ